MKKGKWSPLSSDVLNEQEYDNSGIREKNTEIAEQRKHIINNVFIDFGVEASIKSYTVGSSVTRYNIEYNSDISSRTITNLISDIQIRLGGVTVRFDAFSPGETTVGLEVDNLESETVSFKSFYDKLPAVREHPLAIPLGQRINGDLFWVDLNKTPHVLIVGTTGSGKSVLENTIITTLMMRNSPKDLRFVLIDPKMVELSRFIDAPHLMLPVVRRAEHIKGVFVTLLNEMEERYETFINQRCCSIDEYNEIAKEKGLDKYPYIVVCVDEYADVVDYDKTIASDVLTLAKRAKAAGIHLVLLTQRPSTNFLTGAFKANMLTRVVLMTSSYVDSMTVLGEGGAEKLRGRGDMLVQSPLVSRIGTIRLQGCFINRKEIKSVVNYLNENLAKNYQTNNGDREKQ